MALLAVGIFVGTLIAMPQIWVDLLFVEIRDANSLRHFLGLNPLSLTAEKQWALVAWASSSAWLGGATGVALYLYRPDWLSQGLAWGDRSWALRTGRPVQKYGSRGRIRRHRGAEDRETASAWNRAGAFESWVPSLVEKVFGLLIFRGIRPLQSGRASQYFSTAMLACWAILLGLLWFNRG